MYNLSNTDRSLLAPALMPETKNVTFLITESIEAPSKDGHKQMIVVDVRAQSHGLSGRLRTWLIIKANPINNTLEATEKAAKTEAIGQAKIAQLAEVCYVDLSKFTAQSLIGKKFIGSIRHEKNQRGETQAALTGPFRRVELDAFGQEQRSSPASVSDTALDAAMAIAIGAPPAFMTKK